MQYRESGDGANISILGYGCMRFTRSGGRIDIDKAEKEVMAAIKGGVNYLDTAYLYPGNEEAVGEILARNHCRRQIYLATKLPHYLVKSQKALDRYFEEELRRLRTDYIDFYLIHMLSDCSAWNRLLGLGIADWIAEKKASGQIRRIGFSFHGNTQTFCELVDAYRWDFCQIQYNYLDEHTQAGREGLHYAASKDLPVVIMEPLRGGRLVNFMPERAKKRIAEYPVQRTPAEWAFRWLWDQPEVTCVLSGMNSMEMVRENLRTADTAHAGELTAEDLALIDQIRADINAAVKVGCTGCGYCMPCPHGVDIPNTFRCYNKAFLENKTRALIEYWQVTSMMKAKTADASNCVGCGACEKHCPQSIAIRAELKNAARVLQPFYIRAAGKIVNRFTR